MDLVLKINKWIFIATKRVFNMEYYITSINYKHCIEVIGGGIRPYIPLKISL
jgi:hypothetical protein